MNDYVPPGERWFLPPTHNADGYSDYHEHVSDVHDDPDTDPIIQAYLRQRDELVKHGTHDQSTHGRRGGIRRTSASTYQRAFKQAFPRDSQFYAYVTHYSTAEMAGMVSVTANDNKTGLLVKDHGDGRIEATALFNVSASKGAGLALLAHAMDAYKVNYVEAFGPNLPNLYKKVGFQIKEESPFDEDYAPEFWDYKANDHPNYYVMDFGVRKSLLTPDQIEAQFDELFADAIAEAAQDTPPEYRDAWIKAAEFLMHQGESVTKHGDPEKYPARYLTQHDGLKSAAMTRARKNVAALKAKKAPAKTPAVRTPVTRATATAGDPRRGINGRIYDRLMRKPKTGEIAAIREKHGAKRGTIPPDYLSSFVVNAHYGVDINGIRDGLIGQATAPKTGKRQNFYDEEHYTGGTETKFDRYARVKTRLPAFDKTTRRLMAKNEAMLLVQIIRQTGMRNGGEKQQGTEKAYGATTLLGKHVRIVGNKISFDFPGKSNKPNTYTFTDPQIAKILTEKKATAGPNGQLFPDTNDTDTRVAVSDALVMPDAKVHDLRTALASDAAAVFIATEGGPLPKNLKELKAYMKRVGEHIAPLINDSVTVALGSYIDPSVFIAAKTSAGVA